MTLLPPADNPLLNFDGLPDFAAILPQRIALALDYLIASARERRESLLGDIDKPRWDTLVIISNKNKL